MASRLGKERFANDKEFREKMRAIHDARKGKPGHPNTDAQKRAIGLANTKYFFEYQEMTPELAYVIGVYLSDGYIHNKGSALALTVVDKEFINRFGKAILAVQPNQHLHFYSRPPTGKQRQRIFRVTACNTRFCAWLLDVTNKKAKIPDCVMSAAPTLQAACLSGLFDGDGSAYGHGVYIASSFGWILQAHELCKVLNMNPSDVQIPQYLSDRRPYYRFDIESQHFLDSLVCFSIKRKAQNLQHQKPI